MALAALIVSIAAAIFAGLAGAFAYWQAKIAAETRSLQYGAHWRMVWQTHLAPGRRVAGSDAELQNVGQGTAFNIDMSLNGQRVLAVAEAGPGWKSKVTHPALRGGGKIRMRWQMANGKRHRLTIRLGTPPEKGELWDDILEETRNQSRWPWAKPRRNKVI